MYEVEERIKAAKDEAEAELKALGGEEATPEPEKDPIAPVEPEPKADDQPDNPPDEEEKPKKTGKDYAKERIERHARETAMAEQLRLASERIQALEAALKPKSNDDVAPDRDEDPVGYTEWHLKKTQERLAQVEQRTIEQEKQQRTREIKERALGELQQYEVEAKRQIPDWEAAKTYYMQAVAFSVKALAPNIDQNTLINIVNDRVLNRAAELMRQGHDNPALAMYDEVKTMGYRQQAAEDKPKPDMEKLAKNRSRNAGTAAAASGGDGGRTTASAFASMTNAEFMALPPPERRRIAMEGYA